MFKQKTFVRPPKAPLKPLERQPNYSAPQFSGPVLKDEPVRSPAYRRAVASLVCYRCKVPDFSNACHGDIGKGMAMKSCDLTCWPGCVDRPGVVGCHTFVGRLMSREDRRAFELHAAADTQAALILKSHEDHKLRALLVKLGLVR